MGMKKKNQDMDKRKFNT